MTRPVILRPRAERDARAAFEWCEGQQPGLGDEFLTCLREKLEALRRFPESSPVIYKTVRRAVVSRFPYVVFYLAEPVRVVILAVLHTSRDPAVWPRR